MEKLEFHDFKTLYKKMRAVEKKTGSLPALFNFREFECYFSILCTGVLLVIMFCLIKTNSGEVNNITSISQNMLLYIIAGLIGMLGFIITGLAIMLSTTSTVVINKVLEQKKFDFLLSIFTSFIFIAYIMAFLIVLCTIFYFILGINIQFYQYVFLLGASVVSYLFIFILLYIVSLLATCINIFLFNYNISIEEEKE